jgi:CRISPR-associated endoribonuclease Cas6
MTTGFAEKERAMRLRIQLHLDREAILPIDHQYELMSLVYRLLEVSDTDYARFLHEEGYGREGTDTKRMKLFVFSKLRVPKDRRRVEGANLRLYPGAVEWLVSSPREDFLRHSATGLLSTGSRLMVGQVGLTITGVEALPAPEFFETTSFRCLTAIVASQPLSDGRTYYLRPQDEEAFSEAVRRNLLHKYSLLHGGASPENDRLELTFDADYLSNPKHRGTQKVCIKGIEVVGAFAPFTLTGSTELMEVAWNAGLGEKNSAGFGMIEVAR